MELKIRQLRKAAKMTQADLSKRLGVTQTTVSCWETGVSAPNVNDVILMCELFGVLPNQMFGVEGETLTIPETHVKVAIGPHIACADGDAIPITSEEEASLVKQLAKSRAKSRSGQQSEDLSHREKNKPLSSAG